ncbi:proline--tRNA ligase [Dactylosporangium sp. NPDC048998]|uniref:proline--tRNA ligase n=1 Tax=Dactylosporangium sp. NPDC048998 TaxID=3363976 RepID=UPI003710AC09
MVLKMSSLFLRTLREDPADAEVTSHRLLVRAGYVRRVAPGIFTMLPMGLRVLRNIEQVIREEMDAIGGQELEFPALLPREPYEATGRWTEYGANLFRLKDRRQADYLLGPTHEEMFTLAVKDMCSSYKDLPLTLYQIQTKYRDEARPRAGVLRGREFVMKDSYSFDVDDDGLRAAYARHREAYIKIFDRFGLDYVVCSAMSGAMGGSASEEFLAICEIGEDTFVRCANGDYAANVEAVVTPPPAAQPIEGRPAAQVVDTPGTPTIETLVDLFNTREDLRRADRDWAAGDTLKNVMLMLTLPDGKREPLAVGVPGDREVDLRRLEAQVAPAEVAPMSEAEFAQHPALVKGYIGPGVLGEKNSSGIRYLVDPRVVGGTSWITGADEPGKHVVHLVAGRDFTPDGTVEAVRIQDGDICPIDGGVLQQARGIEIGHIFQLGRKYAQALGLSVLDQNGKAQIVTMGSYGVGVTRALAVIAEQTADERGLCWPRELSPADVHVVAAGKTEEIRDGAEQLATRLEAAGLTVLLDDRKDVSPGVKFNDSELLGVPTIVVVGKRLADGMVEIRDRRSGSKEEVAADGAVAAVQAAVTASR